MELEPGHSWSFTLLLSRQDHPCDASVLRLNTDDPCFVPAQNSSQIHYCEPTMINMWEKSLTPILLFAGSSFSIIMKSSTELHLEFLAQFFFPSLQ